MNDKKFYYDILLTEIYQTGNVDYNYFREILGVSPTKVIQLVMEMYNDGMIGKNGSHLTVLENDDNLYFKELYDLIHILQMDKRQMDESSGFTADEIYIPSNFKNYFAQNPQGN